MPQRLDEAWHRLALHLRNALDTVSHQELDHLAGRLDALSRQIEKLSKGAPRERRTHGSSHKK